MNSKNLPHLNEYSKTMKTMTYEFIGRPKWVRFWSQERPLTKMESVSFLRAQAAKVDSNIFSRMKARPTGRECWVSMYIFKLLGQRFKV